MTRGKKICKELKAVRRRIAEENGISLDIPECTYEGPCRGTCPRCEAEVRFLEGELAHRLRLGRVATVAGLALGLASCGGGQSPQVASDTLPLGDTIPLGDSLPADTMLAVPPPPPDIGNLPIAGDIVVLDADTAVANEEEEEEWMGVVIETDAEFPGGMEALYRFINQNLQYPRLALENNIQGRVYVSFTVEADGTITNPVIRRDIGGGCGKEDLRLVRMMPRWKPGEQQGKPVRTQFNLPINFKRPDNYRPILPGGAEMRPVDDAKPSQAPAQQSQANGVKVVVK